tara:strand:+ start:181 stop:390 length:210 start_codon:yes stop_codon:yes gene_type:complete
MDNVTVNYRGIVLDLEGEHFVQTGRLWDEEPLSDSFETEKVLAGGIDITDLLDYNQLDDLDLLAIETIG